MSNCWNDPDTGERLCNDDVAVDSPKTAADPWQTWVPPPTRIPSTEPWNTMTNTWATVMPSASFTGDGGSASSTMATMTGSTSATNPSSTPSGFPVPNTNHPDTSNQSASSPSPSATPVSPTSNGVAPGAVAGIAIATTILGAAIAFIAAFFIFKRRNASQQAYDDSRVSTPELIASLKGGGKHKSYVSISQSMAAPPVVASSLSPAAKKNGNVNVANLANSSDFLANVLPVAADEVTVKNRCATLFNQILHHVESYYRDVDATITPTMDKDLARFGSESLNMVEILKHSSMPTIAIKHALAGFIMSIVSPEGEEQATLFPTEIVGVKRKERLGESPDDQAAYILYKRLAVHLHTPDTASLASRQSDIREAAEHFALTFFPWANPTLQEQEKDEDLIKIMDSALEISIWLYGQPYQYEFMWEDPGFRGTAITPGLTRTTDIKGRRVGAPEVLLEPIVVATR
ncbi:hypothetical protein CC80DRAFT_487219 [Byssothecium circinans]|uniref:Uncharacterized protein n=1 Tax=Byssothecium circinans TaxID=147558 RepID=A0A6A5UCU3_9PLEO|nr:hypothetical protein CC80DRAFT_487219 [Byssothecium circinans]